MLKGDKMFAEAVRDELVRISTNTGALQVLLGPILPFVNKSIYFVRTGVWVKSATLSLNYISNLFIFLKTLFPKKLKPKQNADNG